MRPEYEPASTENAAIDPEELLGAFSKAHVLCGSFSKARTIRNETSIVNRDMIANMSRFTNLEILLAAPEIPQLLRPFFP